MFNKKCKNYLKNNKKIYKKAKKSEKTDFFCFAKIRGMLCLFAIFNFWRGIFYSWTTTLFWTWILFSCLFCFHSYLLFSLYFYYLQFDFNYAKFVEKIINNLLIVLVMCLFCIIAHFCLGDSSTTLEDDSGSAPASK